MVDNRRELHIKYHTNIVEDDDNTQRSTSARCCGLCTILSTANNPAPLSHTNIQYNYEWLETGEIHEKKAENLFPDDGRIWLPLSASKRHIFIDF